MFSVYIIFSPKLNRFYTGTTDNVERRLNEHNNKLRTDAFSSRGIPWEIFFTIDDLESKHAYAIEAHIKRMKSTTFIRNLKKYPELVQKLKQQYA